MIFKINDLKFVFLLVFLLSLYSCKKDKQNAESEEIQQVSNAYNDIEEIRSKASADTSYANSKEYAKDVERKGIEFAKKTSDLAETDKLIIEYETEVKSLEVYSKKLLKQPKLSEDKTFTDEMLMKATKVRELYQKLSTSTLSAKQKKKFQELSYMK